MKRISLVLAGVALSVLVSAKGAGSPASVESSVAVVKVEGTSLFKLHYKTAKAQDVKISLIDENGRFIYTETVRNTNGFIRPYNFSEVAEGNYLIQVEDESGKTIEHLNYSATKNDKWVNVSKVKGESDKYILRIASSKKDNVSIRIFDEDSNLLHEETQLVDRGFARVYNMKGIDSFTFEVTDSKGAVKSVKR